MKTILAAVVLFSSFLAQADLIKLHDGTVASCNSKSDVARYDISGVYRPVSMKRNGDSARIKIEFMSCVEEKNKFLFKREKSFEDRLINPIISPDRNVQISHSDIQIVVTNGKGLLVDKRPLVKGSDGLYSADINLVASEYDPSPAGRESLEVHVQTKVSITDADTGMIIHHGIDAYGAYRIVVK